MKCVHIGDLHLGKQLGDFSLQEDQEFILDQILDIAAAEQANAILIAGDVYDRSVPSEEAVGLFDRFLRRIADGGMQAYIISGNHDSDERLQFGSSFFESCGIHICGVFGGRLPVYPFRDEFGTVNVCLMPFVKASQVRCFYPEAEIRNYDDAVRTILTHTALPAEDRAILVAHQFVTDEDTDPVTSGSESMGTRHVGLVEKIRSSCFDGFDYVALGHIHSNQPIGRETVRYAGSPLKYSAAEADQEKAVTVLTLRAKGDAEVRQIPLRPKRDLRRLRGTLEQLIANVSDPEDYISAVLTDEDAVEDAMTILQNYYPRTVHVEFDNAHTRQVLGLDGAEDAKERPFREVFANFYREIYGTDPSAEEMALILEVAGEGGVAV